MQRNTLLLILLVFLLAGGVILLLSSGSHVSSASHHTRASSSPLHFHQPLNVSCNCQCHCPPSLPLPSVEEEARREVLPTLASSSVSCELPRAPTGTCTPTVRPLSRELAFNLEQWYRSLQGHSASVGRRIADVAKANSQDGDCLVLDIGANVGSVAQHILQQAPDCRVLSFEAIPWYAEFARQTMDKDHVLAARWQIFATGLSDSDGTAEFLISSDNNFGWNTLAQEKKEGNQEVICVGLRSFDLWLAYTGMVLPHVSAIKIDTEGAEGHVLKGMRNFLTNIEPKPALIVEIAWGPSSPFWEKVVEELEYLFSIGYQRFDYTVITSTTDYIISTTRSSPLSS